MTRSFKGMKGARTSALGLAFGVLSLGALSLGTLLCPSAMGAPLPDRVGAWRLTSEDVTPLATASEDLGRWTRLIYSREAPRGDLEANVMEGSGPGRLRVPEAPSGQPNPSDAVMNAETEYKILDVAGRRAVLERHPVLPLCLAVPVSPDLSLTLESHAADEEELIEFARQAVGSLTGR